jgi:hypothetical protein
LRFAEGGSECRGSSETVKAPKTLCAMNTLRQIGRLVLLIAIFTCAARRQAAAQTAQVVTAIPGGDLRIDPEIRWAIYVAQQTLANPDTSAAEKEAAQTALDEKIDVIVDYSLPVPLLDLAAFVNDARGEIKWVFRSFYGWTGTIARGKIPEVVAALTGGLRSFNAARQITIDPPIGEPIRLAPIFAVESAPTVDAPFTSVFAGVDDAAQTITVPFDENGARFFRVHAWMELRLTDAKIAGDKFVFEYRSK